MSINQVQRPKFFEEQYLGAEDLTAAVEYGRFQNSRHVLGAHTWGIAMGLQLEEQPSLENENKVAVYIQPGYAWDGYGRPIVVLAAYRIPEELFASKSSGQVEVWLRYDEVRTRGIQPGFEVCDAAGEYRRVQETFKVEVGDKSALEMRQDGIVIAGEEIKDARKVLQTTSENSSSVTDNTSLVCDASVPHQTFPLEEENSRWLVPLGVVKWEAGSPGHFAPSEEQEHKETRMFRRYIGVIAEGIYPADGVIRLRSRLTKAEEGSSNDAICQKERLAETDLSYAAETVSVKDLVWVEGNLRVDEDIKLFGGKLDFRDSSGDDHNVPLSIQGSENNGQTGRDLQIRIGQNENGNNRFAVGPQITEQFATRFVVQDDGSVGIGVEKPEHKLQIGDASTTVSLSLRGPDDNSESSILTFEDNAGTTQRWFKFIHDTQGNKFKIASAEVDPILTFTRTTGNVGIGTESPNERLEIAGSIRGDQDGALRISTNTGWTDIGSKNAEWSHFYTDRGKYYFDKEIRVNSGNIGSYDEDLSLRTSGVTRIIVRDSNGNVGIGTTNPQVKLHIEGGTDAEIGRGGFLVVGQTSRYNIVIDNNEIMARNNGAKSPLYVQANGGDFFVHSQRTESTKFIIKDTGNVGIGTSSPGTKLHIIGNRIRLVKVNDSSHFLDMRADGSALDLESGGADLYINNHGQTNTRIRNLVQISSKSLKNNIRSLAHSEAVNLLGRMRPVKFHFKDDETQMPHIGFIAEEVPAIVATNDRQGLRPTDVLAILTRVVQKQQVTITRLLEKVEGLAGAS